jgi:hypothetical protein
MATRSKKPAWRKDRITSDVDPETGRRIVDLPTVSGMTPAQVAALFAFEAEHLGTVRAVIRMNKRAQGDTVPVPAKIAALSIPKALKAYYA